MATTQLIAAANGDHTTISFMDTATAAKTGDGFAGDDPGFRWFADMRRASDGKILVPRNQSGDNSFRLVEADLSGFSSTPDIWPSDRTFTSPAITYFPRATRMNTSRTKGYIGALRDVQFGGNRGSAIWKIDLDTLTREDEWLGFGDYITDAASAEFFLIGVSPDESKAYWFPRGYNDIYVLDLDTSANTLFATIPGSGSDGRINSGIVLANGKLVVGTYTDSGGGQTDDGHYIHVIDTGGSIVSSTNIPLFSTGHSSIMSSLVEDRSDGTVWYFMFADQLGHFNASSATILGRADASADEPEFGSSQEAWSLTWIATEASPSPSPSPVEPPPISTSTVDCHMQPGSATPATGEVLPPVAGTITLMCSGGGDVPSAADADDSEDWA